MKIVNISSFAITFLALLIPTQAFAQVQAGAASGAGALVRIEDGSSTNNESNVGGTVNNIGVNNSSGLLVPGRTTQGAVSCEVPVFEASAGMTNPGNGFSSTQSIVISFRTPIGGQAQANCVAHSGVILQQARLDTTLNLINFCLEMKAAGVTFNETAPPELIEACNMVEAN
jgi:hypothetical protein